MIKNLTTSGRNDKNTFRRRARRMGAAALVLALGTLAPGRALALAPSSDVPLADALVEARAVAALNPHWEVLAVQGSSMEPQFGDSSLLLVGAATFDDLRPGMVVVYRDATGDWVAHRLIQRTADGWVAKGYNNANNDPGLVTAKNLRGVVFGLVHYQTNAASLAQLPSADRPTVAYAKKY
jgi:signal peptidase I